MDNYTYTLDTRGCRLSCKNKHCCGTRKLNVYDWLADMRPKALANELVEVQFKNTRKEYFRNTNTLPIHQGDIVVVESVSGYDIGQVSVIGELVEKQMKKNRVNLAKYTIRKIYRKANEEDMTKYEAAKAREHDTMLRSRQIAKDLNLNMKIGDVDFQGDGTRAIFYYIANEWVDFRELIKVLANTFRIRIEMKQIGARQEAGLIGGIGSCGRELCCSSWMTNFKSVSTHTARYQDLPVNPQKITGQCAKLKCCLNYELDTYLEAQKEIPRANIPLEFEDMTYFHFKTDLLRKTLSYSSEKGTMCNLITLTAKQVKEVLAANKQGKKPPLPQTVNQQLNPQDSGLDYANVIGQDDLTRFDKNKKPKKSRRRPKNTKSHGAVQQKPKKSHEEIKKQRDKTEKITLPHAKGSDKAKVFPRKKGNRNVRRKPQDQSENN